jgi:hypothetical protein
VDGALVFSYVRCVLYPGHFLVMILIVVALFAAYSDLLSFRPPVELLLRTTSLALQGVYSVFIILLLSFATLLY